MFIITKNGRSVHKPIIVKLQSMFDKDLIFKFAKNPEEYNAKRKDDENFNFNAYITDRLPETFQRKQKPLLLFYKGAKKNKQKTVRKAYRASQAFLSTTPFKNFNCSVRPHCVCFVNNLRSEICKQLKIT